MIVQTIFIYMIISSTSLIHGIGLKKLVEDSQKPIDTLLFYAKSIILVTISFFLTWFITNTLLAPHNLAILFPFFALLITALFSIILHHVINLVLKIDTAEFSVSFLSVVLAISNGTSLAHSFLIALIAVNSFYLLSLLLFTIRQRILSINVANDFTVDVLILLAIACITFALYGWTNSWFNIEVFR